MDSVAGSALSERVMRSAMSSLYASMVLSSANTDAIRGGRIHGPVNDAAGNSTAVSCMKELSSWIGELERYTGREDLEDAFLFPIRKSAEALQNMRWGSRRSTDVEGLVFAASSPQYDLAAGRDLKTVSVLVPRLESAMCIRVEEWDKNNRTGWYAFRNVQPVPLVNRMHPTKAHRTRPIESRGGLGAMDFLKCPLSDAESFRKSVAMENFCEVYSRQKQKRHMLGAPLILHGKVTSIDPHRINLSGLCHDKAYLTAYLSEEAGRTFSEGAGGHEGRCARVLVVAWYWSDYDDEKEQSEYEAYIVEEVEEGEALAGDAEGLVRVRGPADVGTMESRYGHVPESPSLVLKGDRVCLRSRGGAEADHVQRQFLDGTEAIRNGRQKSDGSIHSFPKIALGMRVAAPRDDEFELQRILLFVIKSWDAGIPATKDQIRELFPSAFRRRMRKLESRGMLANREGLTAVTDLGRKTAYAYAAEDLKHSLGQLTTPVVFLPELDTGQAPPSFVVRYLKRLGYRRAKVDGHSCGIALHRDGASEREIDACTAKVRDLAEKILDEFCSAPHPLTPAYLTEKIPYAGSVVPAVYVEKVLGMMEGDGRVRRDGGGSWSVPMKDKIRRAFSKHPEEILSKKQIMSMAAVAGTDADAAEEVLHQLRNDGLLSEIRGGRWTTPEVADGVLAREMYEAAKRLVRERLRRRDMDKRVFLVYMEGLLSDLELKCSLLEAAEEITGRLVADGVLEIRDGICRPGPTCC